MKPAFLALTAAFFSACVAVPGAMDEDHLASSAVSTGEAFPPLDEAGAAEQQTQHFQVRAYGRAKAMQIADLCEAAYARVIVDTGLTGFLPAAGRYRIVVYANAAEYRRKTGQPDWTDWVGVGSVVYSFEGPQLEGALSHQLSHLVFSEYMGHFNLEHRWVDEGLALYEESKAGQPASGGVAPALPAWPQGWQPLPLDAMLRMSPASERDRLVHAWYRQAVSMVRFLIERGGRIGFAQFLADLKVDPSLDKAAADAFSGAWKDLSDFYSAWSRAQ